METNKGQNQNQSKSQFSITDLIDTVDVSAYWLLETANDERVPEDVRKGAAVFFQLLTERTRDTKLSA